MSNIVVAGIINRKTGEIVETTTKVSEKTAIRLKVRDELGCKHGRGDYMGFEFNSLCNMSYYKRNMLTDDPSALLELQKLNIKYQIDKTKTALDRSKQEQAFIDETFNSIAILFKGEEHKAQLELVSELFDDKEKEQSEIIKSQHSQLTFLKTKLDSLSAK